jgi:transitional endoplasmic reticulum ATPase
MLGFDFIEVTPGKLGSLYIHGTQLAIKELFADALKRKPCLLFLDEMDAMVPHRRGNDFGYQDNEVNEFLVELNECAQQRILVVGATNRKDNIDPAVLRPGRLDKKFFVGLPDDKARLEQVRLCMANRPQEKIDWKACATSLKGYTCAEITHIVSEAARDALHQDRKIGTEDILHAAHKNPPAHADAMP